MKKVLIIDSSKLFSDFMREKLSAENITVEVTNGRRDAYTRLVTSLPDLVIMDVSDSFTDLMDFLKSKQSDPNAKNIPIILTGPVIEKARIASLVRYGVIKYFPTPIKFNSFIEAIGNVLKISFSVDTTPSILQVHYNNNIIFVEFAQVLNREKISLLKYRLAELIDKEELSNPKVILMMTDLMLSFVDGINLEYLFDTILTETRIQRKNIKILSLDSFIPAFLDGHPQYSEIKVVTDLRKVLSSFVSISATEDEVPELIAEEILTQQEIDDAAIDLRFNFDLDIDDTEGTVFRVAVVDDDSVVRSLLQRSLSSMGAETVLFENGSDFIEAIEKEHFDLAILDIFMQGMSGFDVLTKLKVSPNSPPIIVYSQATQREVVIQALSLGASSYLVKPQKPDVIISKAIEVLHAKTR
ncbi:MAG: response regulator [Treponema sp.]|uniref:response regulator n=1 Tax=Treponema sp. TaxID=166 RepID=UPI00298E2C9D|nr:response regulator [Treponema sp.]MCQ2601170.1 response regulator [Treponema sp.]